MRRGFGPKCARKVKAARFTIAESYSATQLAKADDAISRGLVTRKGADLFAVVSGNNVYLTTVSRCDCKAGEFGRACWHLAAVTVASGTVNL